MGKLHGCDHVFAEMPPWDGSREIDILFADNLNPAVQRERAQWLAVLARLGRRWRVRLRGPVQGEEYRCLLRRSRIVFQFSAQHRASRQAFEAAHAGALLFQEIGNREVADYFGDRQECVFYGPDNLEELLTYYLENEEERQAVVESARQHAQGCCFEDFWQAHVEEIGRDWSALRDRAGRPSGNDFLLELTARCWQSLTSVSFEDMALLADLERSLNQSPESAPLANLLGCMLWRHGRWRNPPEVLAHVTQELFRRALANQPGFALAGLNLAEALEAAGRRPEAVEAAHQTLHLLVRWPELGPASVEGMPLCQPFDTLHVEWDRAAWMLAGQPQVEARAKRDLILWRLHSLLANWTGDLSHAHEACLRRPDLPGSRASLGVALARANRWPESSEHLRRAVADNPLDREAAQALFQVLGQLKDAEGRQQLVEERRLLSQSAPQVIPQEPWFAPPRLRGNELVSLIVFCPDQSPHTLACLERLLQHTRPPFELILVGSGSKEADSALRAAGRKQVPGPARIEVVRCKPGAGQALAYNQGLARARGNFLVLLDGAAAVTPGWLEGLVSAALSDWPNTGLVGPFSNAALVPQVLRPENNPLEGLDALAALCRRTHPGQTVAVNRLSGSCLLLCRELLDRLGGLDERLPANLNALDLCLRAREAGARVLLAQDVYVHDLGTDNQKALGTPPQESDLAAFRAKWGQELAGFYFPLPPLAQDPSSQSPPQYGDGIVSHPSQKGAGGMCERALPLPDANTLLRSVANGTSPEQSGDVSHPSQKGADGMSDQALPLPDADTLLRSVANNLTPQSGEESGQSRLETVARTGTSLCMIVRNEEENLPACLATVEGLFDEIIVVDTGSTDGTVAAAKRFGAKVFEFPWVDSFAAARNECLRHASCKWIMWLDADDRLDAVNRERLRKVLAGLGDELDAHAIQVRSVLDQQRTAFRMLDQVRIFRNLPQVRWDYRIHEQILPAVNRAGGQVRWTNVVVDHVGYQDAGLRRRKLQRNLRLLEMDHVDRPDDSFSLFNLGWTLLDLDRTGDALPHLRRSLEKAGPDASILRKLYHLIAVAQRQAGTREEALQTCRAGLKRFPDDAELLLESGLLLRDQEDLCGAEQSWLSLLGPRQGKYFASEEVGLRGYRTRQMLAEVYAAQDRWFCAEIQWRASLDERADYEPAWQGLAEVHLRRARWAELEELLSRLELQGIAPSRIGWLRARGCVQRGEFAEARGLLERVIEQDPQAIGPRILLSQSLLQDGRDWEAAEEALHSVLELDPDNKDAQHNLHILKRRQPRPVPALTS